MKSKNGLLFSHLRFFFTQKIVEEQISLCCSRKIFFSPLVKSLFHCKLIETLPETDIMREKFAPPPQPTDTPPPQPP